MSSASINVQFQIGIFRETLFLNKTLSLSEVKQLALTFVHKVFRLHGAYVGLEEANILLFIHTDEDELIKVECVTDIPENTIIQIILKNKLKVKISSKHSHTLNIHSYKSPTFCDFCGEMLFGLVRQGLKCEDCGLSFHKRCALKIPFNCYHMKQKNSLYGLNKSYSMCFLNYESTFSNKNLVDKNCYKEHVNHVDSTFTEDTLNSMYNHLHHQILSSYQTLSLVGSEYNLLDFDKGISNKIKVPHTLVIHSYKVPTICQRCKKLLVGIFRQGLQCQDCKLNSCKKCASFLSNDCQGMPSQNSACSPLYKPLPMLFENLEKSNGSISSVSMDKEVENDEIIPYENEEDLDKFDDNSMAPIDQPPTSKTEWNTNYTNMNIPLQRMVVSLKYTKKRGGMLIIKEGWIVYNTNKDVNLKRHFWVLDPNSLTFYKNETDSNFYKRIILDDIVSVFETDATYNRHPLAIPFKREPQKPEDQNEPPINGSKIDEEHDGDTQARGLQQQQQPISLPIAPHCFEIHIHNGLVYNVGLGKGSDPFEPSFTFYEARQWEIALRHALTPITSKFNKRNIDDNSISTNIDSANTHSDQGAVTDPDTFSIENFQESYVIYPKEILGSGQFGTVYGGLNKLTEKSVAIKVILKSRFPSQKESQLKNEVKILQSLSHPGVVNLDRMYESEDKIIVVMEKLAGDMLEMILNNPHGYLAESTTKYLVHQILIALKYLHVNNIVHCDLKPENVLLSSYSEFPQVKLCDFGFARIIGEKSFRRSIVGTPAYLAPEVLRNQGYNRSLDMWSVGVIIYVSLSGTFPFNEDEDINDQIQNASFMYPKGQWESISSNAIDLINNLLRVKIRLRYSVNKCLMHPWLQDFETWKSLRTLENLVGQRYLTDSSDDFRWNAFDK